MPYINEENRDILESDIKYLATTITEYIPISEIAGTMNYTISSLLMRVFQGLNPEGLRYRQVNEIIGVLECIKQELYRRSFGPYEDKAIEKNGDLKEFEIWKV